MKNLKKEKGITLVALIITIIVLLILAVVTISAVNEGSLFSYANNAATAYSAAQEQENTMISNWLTELAKHDKSEEFKDENTDVGEGYVITFKDFESENMDLTEIFPEGRYCVTLENANGTSSIIYLGAEETNVFISYVPDSNDMNTYSKYYFKKALDGDPAEYGPWEGSNPGEINILSIDYSNNMGFNSFTEELLMSIIDINN